MLFIIKYIIKKKFNVIIKNKKTNEIKQIEYLIWLII